MGPGDIKLHSTYCLWSIVSHPYYPYYYRRSTKLWRQVGNGRLQR